MVGEVVVGKLVGVAHGAIVEHHTLGIACGARGVVDDCQVIEVVARISHLLGRHATGVSLLKSTLALLPRLCHSLVAMPQQVAVLHIDGCLEKGHILGIEPFPYIIVGKEQHTVGMGGERRHVRGVEVGKQWHHHSLVNVDAPECHRPSGRVASADGNLLALRDASGLEEEPELLHVSSQVAIGERVASIVTQRLQVPILVNGLLQCLQIVLHRLRFLIIHLYSAAIITVLRLKSLLQITKIQHFFQ